MAFRKKTVEFWQKERDELPAQRPVLIYLQCPAFQRDLQQRTQLYSQFKPAEGLPDGVSVREGNPYNSCLVEGHTELEKLREQLRATLDWHREASYKVLVVNGHGFPEGVQLSGTEGNEKVFLTGEELAELAWHHCHDHHFLTVCGTAYGHKVGDSFIRGIITASGDKMELRKLFVVTYFTSETVPEAWQRPATAGSVHVELKRDITAFLTEHVQPNSPYKTLDARMGKTPSCLLL